MEERSTVSAYNFIIPHMEIGHKLKTKLKKNVKSKKKSAKALTVEKVEAPIIDTIGLAQVLTKYTIFIDDNVQFKEQVGMIAEGMGATVHKKQDDTENGSPSKLSVGIYIVQPKGAEKNKLISRLASKGIKAISPIWLFTCYQSNQLVLPDHFPYNIKSNQIMLSETSKDTEKDDNPFGLEFVDYDYIEANKPGKQTLLDGYVTVESNHLDTKIEIENNFDNEQVEEVEPIQDVNINYNDDDYGEEEEEEDEEDEEEVIRKELNYNKRVSQDTIQEREAKRIASEKRRMEILEGAKKFATRTSKRIQPKKKEIYNSSSVEYGVDRMKIWYEEQPLPTSK